MKSEDLRKMEKAELESKERELSEEYFNLKMQHATGQLENPLTIRHLRKDIARAKTILAEKESEG